MISQIEFVRIVDVQSETIERYIREEKIKPDLEVPIGDRRSFNYFKEETIKEYASEFGWEFITAANMKDKFMDMVKTMDMSFSYKPVLLKAMFEHVDEKGRVRVEDMVDYFIEFYSDRKSKRFEDMRFMKKCREIEYVEFNKHVYRKLTKEDVNWIMEYCNGKLVEYYGRKAFREA